MNFYAVKPNIIQYSIVLFVVFTSFFLSNISCAANPNAPANFTISSSVLRDKPENFGLNLETTAYLPWDMNSTMFNNWTQDSSFEPITLRYRFHAVDGGADFILGGTEETIFSDFTIGSTIRDGFFDGAEVRVYRIVDDEVQHVRTDTVQDYFASETSGYRINLSSTGPLIEPGDTFFLSKTEINVPLSVLGDEVNPQFVEPWQVFTPDTQVQKEYHAAQAVILPASAGQSCLRIDNTANGFAVLGSIHFGPEPHFVNLQPGQTYELNVWLRHEGLDQSWVFFGMEEMYEDVNTVFVINNDWNQYTYQFSVPDYIPESSPLIPIMMVFNTMGTIWMDNFQIHESSSDPYSLREEVVQDVIAFQPGTIRTFNGHTNEAMGISLDSLTLPPQLTHRIWEAAAGTVAPNYMTLPEHLKLCQDAGSAPWIVIGPAFSEDEWRGLIEYLAAPYDPQTDTPASKPWAHRRYMQDQTVPWTDVLDTIRIEFDNEAWNPAYHPWTFTPTEFGQFGEYFFQAAQSSIYYTTDVADTVEFILGGWTLAPQPEGHGHASVQHSSSTNYVASSGYIGGWDSSLAFSHDTITDAGYQDVLLYTPGFYEYFTNTHAQTRDILNASGIEYDLAYYEGGPGYHLPTPENLVNDVEEQYGKSLAALVTLDMMLLNESLNFGPQAFFRLNGGFNFASHTPFGEFRRPHALWLALLMRNLHVDGAMVNTVTNSVPTTDIAPYVEDGVEEIPIQSDRPLVAVYAYCNENDYHVVVISRKLNGTTPVTLNLPFQSTEQTTLRMLTGNPRATNISTNNIQIQESQLGSATGTYTFSMPPGSAYILSFENTIN